jgi:mRNA-degrading endonuclease RelE of RelBE toxin-antitoxin system
MSWDYDLANRVVKNLKRIQKRDRERIITALEEMKINPFIGDLKLIQGEDNLYRRRIGNYRIYFRPSTNRHIFYVPEINRKQSY